jgi:phosphoribosylglycinamide formyltransferase-1
MAALANAADADSLGGARVTDVVGTHPDSPALARARELGLETHVVRGSADAFDERLLATLERTRPDLICLAGYMRMAGPPLLARYPLQIVNIHPALLPSFGGKGMYGHHIHEAVLSYGAKVSGCTVHFVDEEFDHGPVILQECVPVLGNDTPETLAARVLHAEHASYPKAVRWIAEGRVRVEGRVVRIAAG